MNEVIQLTAHDELTAVLIGLCKMNLSGQLSIITENRESASVILHTGDIVGLLYRERVGLDALEKFKSINAAKCRFVDNNARSMKSASFSDLPSTIDTLALMGANIDDEVRKSLGKKILIVDDSNTARKAMSITLRDANYRILEAANGKEALSLLETNTPDLILLDIIMPELDGYEVLKKIREDHKERNYPVVMLTSRDSLFDQVKGKLSNCNEYVTKPVPPEKLLKIVSRHLNPIQSFKLAKH